MRLTRRSLLERYGKPVRRSLVERTQAVAKGEKLRWSPETHVLHDLCMLSPDSRNGRTYTPNAMQNLRELYEGARAYQDHPDDPTAQRSTRERLGRWHNVRIEGGKLRGDLHYDPNHPYAKSLIWAAQECPEHCGVSHNVEAEGYEDPETGHFTVARVNEVRSVDIVDDPATNKSLLESHKPRRKRRKVKEGTMDPELDDMGGAEETPQHKLGAYIMACLDDPGMDPAMKRKHIMKAMDLHAEHGGMEEDEEDGEEVDTHDPEDKRGKPRGQERETDDQFEEEDDEDEMRRKEDDEMESGSDEIRGKNKAGQIRAMWHKDPENPYSESFQARESLQRLRNHKDRKVRAVAEIALRALPHPRRRRQAATESLSRHSDPAVRAMAKRLDALEAEKSAVSSVRKAIQECKAAGLPKRVMTRLFIEDLADCPHPKRRRMMIQERAHLASISLPRSHPGGGPGGGPPRISDAEFAGMVNGDGEY